MQHYLNTIGSSLFPNIRIGHQKTSKEYYEYYKWTDRYCEWTDKYYEWTNQYFEWVNEYYEYYE